MVKKGGGAADPRSIFLSLFRSIFPPALRPSAPAPRARSVGRVRRLSPPPPTPRIRRPTSLAATLRHRTRIVSKTIEGGEGNVRKIRFALSVSFSVSSVRLAPTHSGQPTLLPACLSAGNRFSLSFVPGIAGSPTKV